MGTNYMHIQYSRKIHTMILCHAHGQPQIHLGSLDTLSLILSLLFSSYKNEKLSFKTII